MEHLKKLENQSIFIIREGYSQFRKVAMLWSIGKDSTCLLSLIRKAFFGKIPFPIIHLDTGYKFKEIYAFRDKYSKEWDLNLIVSKNQEAIDKGVSPQTGKFQCCTELKTNALKKAIAKYGFKALYLAIRRDEHGIRAKERIFSLRDEDFVWDYKNQPPELWDQYKIKAKDQEHLRIHPLLGWRECLPKGHAVITNPGVKDISGIKIGDTVLGHDGNYHTVIDTFSRIYQGDLIEILPYNLPSIRATENHPIYVAELRRCENNVYCAPTCYNLKKCTKIRKRSEETLMNRNLALILYENGRDLESISKTLGINKCIVWEWLCNKKYKVRYQIVDKPYFLDYEPRWIPAGDITENHYVLIPYLKSRKNIDEITLSDKKKIVLTGRNQGRFLRLCGYYVSEGFIIKNQGGIAGVGFSFGPKELSLVKDADNCIRKVFGLSPSRHKYKTTISLRFYSKEVAEFFTQNFGAGAENKRVPKFILDLKPEKLGSFIRACIKGDGCVYRKPKGTLTYQYTTISRQLAFQMFLLFTKFGVIPSIAIRENNDIIKNKKYRTKRIYVISTSFSSGINRIIREKRGVPKEKVRKRGFFWRGFCWLPIRKVKRKSFKGTVYNMEVEEVNSYTSNLIAVHNCDIWEYIKKENIPIVSLYFAKGNKRYRSIGCQCCCSPIDSNADTIDKIIEELRTSRVSERSGRAQDKESAYIMQKLRSLGYMSICFVAYNIINIILLILYEISYA
jgi:3'-phosphoadenosine 5'-phosphosulfate sulfotransferase (PAPS reductase)/FAD synthetase